MCSIDKLMWVFCKIEYVKYKKVDFLCKIEGKFAPTDVDALTVAKM